MSLVRRVEAVGSWLIPAVQHVQAHLVTNGSRYPEYTRGKGNYGWMLSWTGRQSGIMAGPNHRLRAALDRLKNGEQTVA